MSNMPPNMPPGGGVPPPIPPYDPKTQWRAYRAQQKAAWRAQRDAWKSQRQAWGGYGGLYGPRVPSIVGPILLIGIGAVALLVVTGHLSANTFWTWYARWWPLLLIGAGLALLGEWALDMRSKTPVRRSGSFIGILILLALLGFGAAGWHSFWGPFRAQFGNSDNDFFNAFGLPEHDLDQQPISQAIPANALVQIQNPRGDVNVTSGSSASLEVLGHEVAFAGSDSDAQKIFESEKATVTINGNTVTVRSQGNSSGRVNLAVTIPPTAKVSISAGRGDVTAASLGAGISIEAGHGDVHLNTIKGGAQVRFSGDRGDLSARQIEGELALTGNCNDLTLSAIQGRVSTNGQIFGSVQMDTISGPLSLHTSVTDVQVAELPGDLTLNSDDLNVTQAKGQVRVTTHAKDVELNQIYGDTYVQDRDGRIAIAPAGSYAIEAHNEKGDVEVTLPPNVQATVNGNTHNGDIVTDFALAVSGDENKAVSGNIGKGGPRILLSASNGDLRIKRGSEVSAAPPPPFPPPSPHAPHAPRLKAPSSGPVQPVTQ